MLSVEEAWQRILQAIPDFGTETVTVSSSAGRILRQSVAAERDQPPFDRVTMDGVAVRYDPQRTSFRVQGTQYAGEPALTLDSDSLCIEIMTGAVLPIGTDTVVPVERIRADGDRRDFEPGYVPEHGQFVHRRGSDHRAGKILLESGVALAGPEVAVLAAQGLAEVEVGRTPPAAVVSTGNELVGAGEPIAAHEIRMCNGAAIVAELERHAYAGSREVHLRDEPVDLRERLGSLLDTHRVLVLSGGVSKGKADHVPDILAELGVEKRFHRVAQRPGLPLWFGSRGKENLVFALPGNPVSTLVCFRRYVLPALQLASGRTALQEETVVLDSDYAFRPGLTCFLPVRIVSDGQGSLRASPVVTNTSGDFSALAGTAGFVELPADRSEFPAGTTATLYRWRMAA